MIFKKTWYSHSYGKHTKYMYTAYFFFLLFLFLSKEKLLKPIKFLDNLQK